METVTPGWRFVHIGCEGDAVTLGGVEPWASDWGQSVGRIVVAHPQYPNQRHPMWIYQLFARGRVVVFAAGEFSNGVWGFFERDPRGVE